VGTEVPEWVADPGGSARPDEDVEVTEQTYVDRALGQIVVSKTGDALSVEMPLLASMEYEVDPELITVSSDTFWLYIEDSPHDLTFIADGESGESRWLRNRGFVGTRQQDPVAVTPVSLSPRLDAPGPILRH